MWTRLHQGTADEEVTSQAWPASFPGLPLPSRDQHLPPPTLGAPTSGISVLLGGEGSCH